MLSVQLLITSLQIWCLVFHTYRLFNGISIPLSLIGIYMTITSSDIIENTILYITSILMDIIVVNVQWIFFVGIFYMAYWIIKLNSI